MSTPPASYVRRRAFNKVHVRSWLIYLEKDGYVKCSFKNCNFMAQDVTEMGQHFGVCNGDNSLAKFACTFCGGCTASQEKLHQHLAQAHNMAIQTPPDPKPLENPDIPHLEKIERLLVSGNHKRPSRIEQVAWECFFEKNNYVKCTTCSYLAPFLSDIFRHHQVCKQEKELLLYVCEVCRGRTINVNALIWHMEQVHTIYRTPQQFNHISKTMIQFWEKEIQAHSYSSCLHVTNGQRDCFYIDTDVLSILSHCQTCKGPEFHEHKVICDKCKVWTDTKAKLNFHTCFGLITLVNIEKKEEQQLTKAVDKKETLQLTNVSLQNSQENPDRNKPRPNIMTGKLLAQTLVESIESSSKHKSIKPNTVKVLSKLSKPQALFRTAIVKSDQQKIPFEIGLKTNARKSPSLESPTNYLNTQVDSSSKLVQHFTDIEISPKNEKPMLHKLNLENQKLILKKKLVGNENLGKVEATATFGKKLTESITTSGLSLIEGNGSGPKMEYEEEEGQSGFVSGENVKRSTKCVSLFEDAFSSDDDCILCDSTEKQKPMELKQETTEGTKETTKMKKGTSEMNLESTDMTEFCRFSSIKRSPIKSYTRKFKQSAGGCSESPGSTRKDVNSVDNRSSGFKKEDLSKMSTKINFEHTSTIFENCVKTYKDLPEITSKSSEKSDKLIVAPELVLNAISSKSLIKHHANGSFFDTTSSLEEVEIKLPSVDCTHPSVEAVSKISNLDSSSQGIETNRLEPTKPDQIDNSKVLFFFNKKTNSELSSLESQKKPLFFQFALDENIQDQLCTKDTNKIYVESILKLEKSDDTDNTNLPRDHSRNISLKAGDSEDLNHSIGDVENSSDSISYSEDFTHEVSDTEDINCLTNGSENVSQSTSDSENIVLLKNETESESISHHSCDIEQRTYPASDTESISRSTGVSENISWLKDECASHPISDTEDNAHPNSNIEDMICPVSDSENICQSTVESENISWQIKHSEWTSHPAGDTEDSSHLPTETEDSTRPMSKIEGIMCFPISDSENICQPMVKSKIINRLNNGTEHTSQLTIDNENTSYLTSDLEKTRHPTSDNENTSHPIRETENTVYPTSDHENTSYLTGDLEKTRHPTSDSENTSHPTRETENTIYPTSDNENTSHPTRETENTVYPTSDNENTSYLTGHLEKTRHPTSDSENTSHPTRETENTIYPTSDNENTSHPTRETENTIYPTNDHENTSHPTRETENTVYPTSDNENTSYLTGDLEKTRHPTSDSENTSHPIRETENTIYPTSDTENTSYLTGHLEKTTHPNSHNENTSHPTRETENTIHPPSDNENTSHPTRETENTIHPPSDNENTSHPTRETENTIHPPSDNENTSHPTRETENTIYPTSDNENTSYLTSDLEKTRHPNSHNENTSHPTRETENTIYPTSDNENTSLPTRETENTICSTSDNENTSYLTSDLEKSRHLTGDNENTSHPTRNTVKISHTTTDTENTSHPTRNIEENGHPICNIENISHLLDYSEDTCHPSIDSVRTSSPVGETDNTTYSIGDSHDKSNHLLDESESTSLLQGDTDDTCHPTWENTSHPIDTKNTMFSSGVSESSSHQAVDSRDTSCQEITEGSECTQGGLSFKSEVFFTTPKGKFNNTTVGISESPELGSYNTSELLTENLSTILTENSKNITSNAKININITNQVDIEIKDTAHSLSETEVVGTESFEEIDDRSMSPVVFDDMEHLSSDEDIAQDQGSPHIPVQGTHSFDEFQGSPNIPVQGTQSIDEFDTKPLLTNGTNNGNIDVKRNCTVITNTEVCSFQLETQTQKNEIIIDATCYSKDDENTNSKENVEFPSDNPLFKTGLVPRKELENPENLIMEIKAHNSEAEALDNFDSKTTGIEISVEHVKEINCLNEIVETECMYVETKDDLSPRQVEDVLVSLYSDDIEQMLNLSNSCLKNLTQNKNYNPCYTVDLTTKQATTLNCVNKLLSQETFEIIDKSLALDAQSLEACTSETESSNRQELSEMPITVPNVKKRGRPPKKKNEHKTITEICSERSASSQRVSGKNISGTYKISDQTNTSASLNFETCEINPSLSTKKCNDVKISEKLISAHPEPLIKKRGRPPKNKTKPSINNEICIDTSEKDLNVTIGKTTNSGVNLILPDFQTVSSVGTDKDVLVVVPNKSILSPLTQTPRKRGRPFKKKSQSEINSINTDHHELVQSTFDDRINDTCERSKTAFSDLEVGKMISSTSTEKEKSIIRSDTTILTPSSGQARKRGRPPKQKNVIRETIEMNSLIENKKNQTEQKNQNLVLKEPSEENLQLTPIQHVKRRGRPKRPKLEPSSSTPFSKNLEPTGIKSDSSIVYTPENTTKAEINGGKTLTSFDEDDDETPLLSRIVNRTSTKRGRKRKISSLEDHANLDNSMEIKSQSRSAVKLPQQKKRRVIFNKRPRKAICNISSTNDVSSKNVFKYSLTDYEPLDKVVCGACNEEMSFEDYKTHSLSKHYLLSWTEGDPPLDLKDTHSVVSRLWVAKRFLGKEPFRCHLCKTTKLSAVGFQSHIQFCGANEEEKEGMMWTCNLCGSKMMPSSKRNHMNFSHSLEMSNSAESDASLIIPRAKRAAANRAEEVIQASQQDLEDGPQSPASCSETANDDLKMIYCKPSKIIPKDIRDTWLTTLEESGRKASCPNEGCDFTSDVFLYLRRHFFYACKLTPIRFTEYRCKVCDFHRKDESELQKHVLDKHPDKISALEDSYPESSEESDSDSNAQSTSAHRGFYNPNHTLIFKFLKQNRPVTYKKRGRNFLFSESYKWTLQLREDILTPDLVLYADMQPSADALTPHEAAQYLPPLQSSVPFCGKDGVYRCLGRFQSTLLDGVPVMFAGGPVWATAWAPVPNSETKQFLALATLPQTELLHQVSSVYSYHSLIQIWAFDKLPNIQEAVEAPTFMLGLGHGHGAVWKLCWCPSGCYQGNRLGLLAAACSDGTVAIYSIPQHCPTESCIQVARPVVELKLGCEMLAQCTSLDWHSVSPHNLISGGFANGLVALWDLNTNSPLLRDGTTIYPFKVVEAHQSSVSAVAISPTYEDEAYMMTASLDRCTKFWQLGDLTAPVNVNRKAGVLDATMPSHWLTSISASDDVYSLNNSYVTGYSFREALWSSNNNFMLQAGSVWSVSFNDWINSCALASEVGKLTVFFRQQILVHEEHKKVQKHSKYGDIIHCSLVHLNEKVADKDYSSYTDCNSKLGLKFNLTTQSLELKKADTGGSFDMYPLLSFNNVSWNQNEKSFLWLCAGMQSGLVLTPRLSSLSHTVSNWTTS